jgi:hypothetical protein
MCSIVFPFLLRSISSNSPALMEAVEMIGLTQTSTFHKIVGRRCHDIATIDAARYAMLALVQKGVGLMDCEVKYTMFAYN